jgi:alkanesulfonate monooxygenase SsuD/methylene tetrahydromethanopterin reductase-like flavin-dependent oxidoreductase (luciferase family)
VTARRGIFVAPFDELVEPRTVAELASRAEEQSWDGFFLWDHIRYRPPTEAVADPWIALTAIALATERLRIGHWSRRWRVAECRSWRERP